MGWLSFLNSKTKFDPSTYEKELTLLSKKISKNEKSIIKLQTYRNSIKNSLIIYGILLYLIISIYLFKSNRINNFYWKLIWSTLYPLILTTIILLTTFIYNQLIKSKSFKVELLRSQHNDKIDELKELTKFQTTQNLIQRFQNGDDILSNLSDEISIKQQKLDELNELYENKKIQSSSLDSNIKSGRWVNSIINSINDPNEFNPNNRFALICNNCQTHNGLAPPETLPQYVKYICPKCGLLNGIDKPLDSNKLEESSIEQEESFTTDNDEQDEGTEF
ncbi:hypothetical protein WICMUC_001235 [Wickerhamomyces mucosus]|uniref:Endoplasmic reticulum junction formation protein lunapark n=1 Tax=Wickerhamomyces mucosus TaxID=1378264 RepID=A0A9P8THP0_9ASCO|nr:hypothetical protein WICMUC_001235 [Wickerhamomyces mucosus]